MIIVRSAFDINSFLGNLNGRGIGLLDNDLGFGIILVGSAKILAKVSKLYGTAGVPYIVVDYGDYLFVNRIKGKGKNDRVSSEQMLLKTGIKYDVVLAMDGCPIDFQEIDDVPRLEVPGWWATPIDALFALDDMFADETQQ